MSCNPCSSPSPPQAPPPAETAQAQTQSNLQTAIANARLNRVNQSTPWGSINYTEGPPDANGVPTWSSNIQLSPEQQQLLTQQQAMQLQRGNIGQSLLNRTGDSLSKPLDLSGLHAINDRGSQYQGAINRPQPMMSDNARMMQAMGGAVGQIGGSAGNAISQGMGAAGGPLAQLMQVLMSNPQLAQKLQQMMGGANGPMGGMPQMPQGAPQALTPPGALGNSMGGGMAAPDAIESRQQLLAQLLRAQ